MCVYFSTGGGRTGTFIAIDTLLDQMDKEDHIDVFEVIQNLLLQRVHMVQTVVRKLFILAVHFNFAGKIDKKSSIHWQLCLFCVYLKDKVEIMTSVLVFV